MSGTLNKKLIEYPLERIEFTIAYVAWEFVAMMTAADSFAQRYIILHKYE